MPKKKKEAGPTVLVRPNGQPVTPRQPAPMISPSRRSNPSFDPLAELRPASRMLMSASPSTAPVGDGVKLIGGRLLRTYQPLLVLEGHENAVYDLLDIGGGKVADLNHLEVPKQTAAQP